MTGKLILISEKNYACENMIVCRQIARLNILAEEFHGYRLSHQENRGANIIMPILLQQSSYFYNL